jgi:protein O-GlcNAc transferase
LLLWVFDHAPIERKMAPPRGLDQLLAKGMAAHSAGNLAEAQACYRAVLKAVPKHHITLHYLGISYFQQGKPDRGIDFVRKALAIKPDYAEAHYNLGSALQGLGRHGDAVTHYRKALALGHDNADLHNNLGAALQQVGRPDEAIAHLERALALQPGNAQAQNNLGAVLNELGHHEQAIERFRQVLAADPHNPEVNCNLAAALNEVKRHDEALAIYQQVLAREGGPAEAHVGYGNALGKLNRHAEALAAYDQALALREDVPEAWLGKGTVLSTLNQNEEAIAAYDRALANKPEFPEAWVGFGNVLSNVNRANEAMEAYDKAIALKPALAQAWAGRGNALNLMQRYGEAVASYDNALALAPDLDNIEGARLHAKMHNCDWTNFGSECAQLLTGVREGKAVASPFVLLGVPASPADQLKCARTYVRNELAPAPEVPLWHGERSPHDRIRVAYLSSYFHDHAMPRLLTGLFENHDRKRFETVAISYGIDDDSATRRRVLAAFERVVDARVLSDRGIAQAVRDLEIDIAIDVNGFTLGARPNALTLRPAPVQAHYVGFTGTMGAHHIDYILADEIVIPPQDRQHYSEKVATLPHSYQANDALGRKPEGTVERRQQGLPDGAFVFCSFNNSYKITPEVFDIWTRLLDRVAGSVLWLMQGAADSADNLRREAEKRGVAADRILFAPRATQKEHLARQRLADLFLDTLPYNAHTTTSDALIAGLPVVTRLGPTFAGRVAGSLLAAVGLPDLITHSAEEYEALAFKLASEPALLASVREKLMRNLATEPLFDSARSARAIEAAYTIMWERHQRGEPPESFTVEKS